MASRTAPHAEPEGGPHADSPSGPRDDGGAGIDERVAALIDRNFTVESGTLCIGGVPADALAREFGTPLYAYDGGVIDRTITAVRGALGADVDVHYALKANPAIGVAARFARHGFGAEVASHGEWLAARRAAFAPDRILFAGPGKSTEELAVAIREGVGCLNVECEEEVDDVTRIAADLGVVANVALRINPDCHLRGARMRMTGGPSKFGIDRARVAALWSHLASMPSLRPRGVHAFVGTQIFDVDSLLAHCRATLEFAAELDVLGPVETVNLGGGWGVPYFEGDTPFDLASFGVGLRTLADESRSWFATPPRLLFEPGRYLVAEAGVYLARVERVKASHDRRFVVLDGGMHHHALATGNLGQVFRRPFPLAAADRLRDRCDLATNVVGPLCTPIDEFAESYPLPDLRRGDLVAVLQSGAYGYTAGNLAFLGHATPAEVLVADGRAEVIRDAGRPDDWLRGQRIPD